MVAALTPDPHPPTDPGSASPPHATACFSSIFDPAVVEQAEKAGVGAWIPDLSLGGKHDELHGKPIECSCYVRGISDGRFRYEAAWGGGHASMGKTARLWIGGVDVLVSCERGQTLSQVLLFQHLAFISADFSVKLCQLAERIPLERHRPDEVRTGGRQIVEPLPRRLPRDRVRDHHCRRARFHDGKPCCVRAHP